jgi:Asp-tRNA(Asn)/Glu-tRNA(Gln) amidotransferase A subunit family amidase
VVADGISHADYLGWTARDLVKHTSSGAVSSLEVIELCIDRILSSHEQINALVVPLFDQARTEAAVCDAAAQSGGPIGPLHGVPITVKESFDVRGTPTTRCWHVIDAASISSQGT